MSRRSCRPWFKRAIGSLVLACLEYPYGLTHNSAMQQDLKDKLSTLRQTIDELDEQLLSILYTRTETVKKVGELKTAANQASADDKLVIHPTREAEMIRRFVSKSRKVIPPQTISSIWRAIISASVNLQKPLKISAPVAHENADGYWLAREYFGPSVNIQVAKSSEASISEVETGSSDVAVVNLEDPSNWWLPLAQLSSRKEVYLFAQLPFIYNSDKPKQTDRAWAIGKVHLTPSGQDQSVFVLSFEDMDVLTHLSTYLKDRKIAYDILGKDSHSAIVQIEGFWISKDDALYADISTHVGRHLEEIVPVGAFATPLDLAKENT
ncbi:MAG: chorismate mutase [Candidatus Marinamargulisbacteria bacterium]|jgi:chorismate mutase